MKSIEEKIKEIKQGNFEVHHIFKKMVSKNSAFTRNEEIIDLIFIRRKRIDERDENSPISSPAKLLLATTQGLVYTEEGFEEISDDYYGYRMKDIYYDKLSSLELDISLLQGKFKVTANSSDKPEININFNAGIYYQEFENFLDVVRQYRIKYND